jgi:hypothetical protein
MSVQFFNFGNQQTFHYFDWLTRSGSVDTDQLIARAFEELAKNTDDQITLTEEAMGTSEALRDVLARQLRERLEAILPLQADLWAGPWIGDVDGSEESLWTVILYDAARDIDLHAVAQALLIRSGNWAPSNERPEAI